MRWVLVRQVLFLWLLVGSSSLFLFGVGRGGLLGELQLLFHYEALILWLVLLLIDGRWLLYSALSDLIHVCLL